MTKIQKKLDKRPQIAKQIINKNEAEGITIPDFNMCYTEVNTSKHADQWKEQKSQKLNSISIANQFLVSEL